MSNLHQNFVQLAGVYRDLLSCYQSRVNTEIEVDKTFIIPDSEFETYLLLHEISMTCIILLDKMQLFDRKFDAYERFIVSESKDPE